ncbi:PrgI family protein [Patescibacteria group bacterium]|nr:PrgI family protein [Patescibacteria group bacterium]
MRFQVPQFIEVEDKVFGPFTVRQFIYLGGGAGLSFILYTYLSPISFILAVLAIAPVIALTLALALYKVNNRDFIYIMEAAFKYFASAKLYIWRKTPRKIERAETAPEAPAVFVPKLSESKLRDLTWSLDINENLSPGANETMRSGR